MRTNVLLPSIFIPDSFCAKITKKPTSFYDLDKSSQNVLFQLLFCSNLPWQYKFYQYVTLKETCNMAQTSKIWKCVLSYTTYALLQQPFHCHLLTTKCPCLLKAIFNLKASELKENSFTFKHRHVFFAGIYLVKDPIAQCVSIFLNLPNARQVNIKCYHPLQEVFFDMAGLNLCEIISLSTGTNMERFTDAPAVHTLRLHDWCDVGHNLLLSFPNLSMLLLRSTFVWLHHPSLTILFIDAVSSACLKHAKLNNLQYIHFLDSVDDCFEQPHLLLQVFQWKQRFPRLVRVLFLRKDQTHWIIKIFQQVLENVQIQFYSADEKFHSFTANFQIDEPIDDKQDNTTDIVETEKGLKFKKGNDGSDTYILM